MFKFISKTYNGILFGLMTSKYRNEYFYNEVIQKQAKEHEELVDCFTDHFGGPSMNGSFDPKDAYFEINEACPKLFEAWTAEELSKYEEMVLERAFFKMEDGCRIPNPILNNYLKINAKPILKENK